MRLQVVTLLVLSGCQCLPGLQPASTLPLNVTPTTLTFAPTIVGTSSGLSVDVSNPNRITMTLEHSHSGPFEVDVPATLEGGGSFTVAVRFRPTAVGPASGSLTVNGVAVALSGEGTEAPTCTAASACETSTLDPDAMQCVSAQKPDGAACESRCLSSGTCTAGACVGQSTRCDDQDACTLDTCDEARGCSSLLRVCPAPSPCHIATCDPVMGCGSEEAPDGTLCSPDDCLATEMDVCIAGACVKRPRPESARCTNTWLPIDLAATSTAAMAYDEVKQVTLLYRSVDGQPQTWLWDGARWTFKLPTNSPRFVFGFGMTWNPVRRRVLLYGGMRNSGQVAQETWEWDGSTWLQLRPVRPANCTADVELVWEPTSRTVLMQCYSAAGQGRRLWRFTGTTWEDLSYVPWSTNAHLFLDEATRTVFALEEAVFLNTWRLTSTGFQRTTSNTVLSIVDGCWGVDPLTRETVVLVDENSGADVRLWRFTNGQLIRGQTLPLQNQRRCATAFDRVRNRLVLKAGGGETREWDGRAFTVAASSPSTSFGRLTSTPTGVTLLGGPSFQHFDWDGRGWLERTVAPIAPVTTDFAIAWDAPRSELVAHLSDSNAESTWRFDGGGWARQDSTTLPVGRPVMTWSPALRRLVLTKAGSTALWTFEGTEWRPTVDGGPASGFFDWAMSVEQAGWPLLFKGGWPSASMVSAYRVADAGWEQLPSPALRLPIAAALDPSRSVVVALGASADGGMSTVEWNGTAWTIRRPTLQPPTSAGASAWDSINGRVLFFQPEGSWVFVP